MLVRLYIELLIILKKEDQPGLKLHMKLHIEVLELYEIKNRRDWLTVYRRCIQQMDVLHYIFTFSGEAMV